MLHLMADAETLGLSENAVILQWGLVAFNDDYEIVSELSVNIDVTASIMEGYEIQSGTIDFWKQQPTAAQAAVLFDQPRLAPSAAAEVINRWLIETFDCKNFELWANGILFDIPKLDRFLERYGWDAVTARTKYNKVNDLRTLSRFTRRLYPELHAHAKESIPNVMQHHALADSIWQIQLLGEIHAILANEYDLPKKSVADFATQPMSDYPAPAPVAEEVAADGYSTSSDQLRDLAGAPIVVTNADLDDFDPEEDDFLDQTRDELLRELDEETDQLIDDVPEHVDPPLDEETDEFMAHLFGAPQ